MNRNTENEKQNRNAAGIEVTFLFCSFIHIKNVR